MPCSAVVLRSFGGEKRADVELDLAVRFRLVDGDGSVWCGCERRYFDALTRHCTWFMRTHGVAGDQHKDRRAVHWISKHIHGDSVESVVVGQRESDRGGVARHTLSGARHAVSGTSTHTDVHFPLQLYFRSDEWNSYFRVHATSNTALNMPLCRRIDGVRLAVCHCRRSGVAEAARRRHCQLMNAVSSFNWLIASSCCHSVAIATK
mmetsp:Transcript_17412/g.30382  ORF Transcript_17412/g.30382 Transcript_17412/m.30382 type:complete len:206 (-) Transcript_17412:4781-5398(-)